MTEASRALKLNYSSAKSVMHTYKSKGRICKATTRVRGQPKVRSHSNASSQSHPHDSLPQPSGSNSTSCPPAPSGPPAASPVTFLGAPQKLEGVSDVEGEGQTFSFLPYSVSITESTRRRFLEKLRIDHRVSERRLFVPPSMRQCQSLLQWLILPQSTGEAGPRGDPQLQSGAQPTSQAPPQPSMLSSTPHPLLRLPPLSPLPLDLPLRRTLSAAGSLSHPANLTPSCSP